MAGEEGAVMALLGVGFFLFYLGKTLEEQNLWIGSLKIFAMGLSFITFMGALQVSLPFLVADAAGTKTVELLIAAMGIFGFLTMVILGISWVVGILRGMFIARKAKEDEV